MNRILHDRQVLVWLGLLLATALTGAVGLEGSSSRPIGVLLLFIGIFKLRLVALHFMEVATAPRILRYLIEAYAAVLFVVLVVIYLVE